MRQHRLPFEKKDANKQCVDYGLPRISREQNKVNSLKRQLMTTEKKDPTDERMWL